MKRPGFSQLTGERYARCHRDPNPDLKAILNGRSFWRDPSLRLPNFDQTLAKYNETRKKILDNVDTEQQVNKGTGVRLIERTVKDDQLNVAWHRVRVALLTDRPGMSSSEDHLDQVETKIEE